MRAGDGGVQIPEGFDIVDITNDPDAFGAPAINNCGQIVFSKRINQSEPGEEIFLYDNGLTLRLTNDNVRDAWPDINDQGTIVWTHWAGNYDENEIYMLAGGEVSTLGFGSVPAINNLGQVAWKEFHPIGCASPSDILLDDGNSVTRVYSDGLSNQSVKINDYDELVWTSYDFCPNPWRSDTMLYTQSGISQLTNGQIEPQIPDINNDTLVVWGGPGGIELWQDGETTLLTDWGRNPHLNNQGDIYFLRWHDENSTWQGWVYHNSGQFYQITNDEVWNTDGHINDAGEVTWRWANYATGDRGVRLMRRVRTGDADFDGDIDADDFFAFDQCSTGPQRIELSGFSPETSLCECRFLDIDHDGDVDFADFSVFQVNFTGTQ